MKEELTLYTFVCEINLGTFIEQVNAKNIKEAIDFWSRKLDFNIIGIKEKYKQKFLKDLECEEPIELSGMVNCWCICPWLGKKAAIVHIIETVLPVLPR